MVLLALIWRNLFQQFCCTQLGKTRLKWKVFLNVMGWWSLMETRELIQTRSSLKGSGRRWNASLLFRSTNWLCNLKGTVWQFYKTWPYLKKRNWDFVSMILVEHVIKFCKIDLQTQRVCISKMDLRRKLRKSFWSYCLKCLQHNIMFLRRKTISE